MILLIALDIVFTLMFLFGELDIEYQDGSHFHYSGIFSKKKKN